MFAKTPIALLWKASTYLAWIHKVNKSKINRPVYVYPVGVFAQGL